MDLDSKMFPSVCFYLFLFIYLFKFVFILKCIGLLMCFACNNGKLADFAGAWNRTSNFYQ